MCDYIDPEFELDGASTAPPATAETLLPYGRGRALLAPTRAGRGRGRTSLSGAPPSARGRGRFLLPADTSPSIPFRDDRDNGCLASADSVSSLDGRSTSAASCSSLHRDVSSVESECRASCVPHGSVRSAVGPSSPSRGVPPSPPVTVSGGNAGLVSGCPELGLLEHGGNAGSSTRRRFPFLLDTDGSAGVASSTTGPSSPSCGAPPSSSRSITASAAPALSTPAASARDDGPHPLPALPAPLSSGTRWADVEADGEKGGGSSDDASDALDACDTCQSRTTALAWCALTSTWHCNGLDSGRATRSCIIRHLQLHGCNEIILHPRSPHGHAHLQCCVSGSKDAFILGFCGPASETQLIVVTREVHRERYEAHTFFPVVVFIDTQPVRIASWLLPTDGPTTALTAALQTRIQRRAQHEALKSTQLTYNDAAEHFAVYSPLVAAVAEEDARKTSLFIHKEFVVHWSVGIQREPLALFSVSQYVDPFIMYEGVVLHRLEDRVDIRGRVVRATRGEYAVSIEQGSILLALAGCPDDVRQAAIDHPSIAGTATQSKYSVRREVISVSYDRQQTALAAFVHDPHSINHVVRQRILNPSFTEPPIADPHQLAIDFDGLASQLNDRQLAAHEMALRCAVSLLKGPPGTGKTRTTALIIRSLVALRGRALACAPSNHAADNLTLACDAIGISVLRYLPITRDAAQTSRRLPSRLLVWQNVKVDSELARLRALRSTSALPASQQLRFRELQREAQHSALDAVDLIVCTCSAAGDPILLGRKFASLVIDEAAQCTEPEAMVPITTGVRSVLLVGDESQLSPSVSEPRALAAGLGVSLFERLLTGGIDSVQLDTQYRMHPAISLFPSERFYAGGLHDGKNTRLRFRPDVTFPWPCARTPLFFWHVKGPGELKRGGAISNATEATAVQTVVDSLVENGAEEQEIVVITPYEAQRQLISTLFRTQERTVEVGNIDALQGREKPFVILSLVRSGSKTVGFLNNPRRANVALTRAQSGMVIIGDADTLGQSSLWCDLLQSLRTRRVVLDLSGATQSMSLVWTGELSALSIHPVSPRATAGRDVNIETFCASFRNQSQVNCFLGYSHLHSTATIPSSLHAAPHRVPQGAFCACSLCSIPRVFSVATAPVRLRADLRTRLQRARVNTRTARQNDGGIRTCVSDALDAIALGQVQHLTVASLSDGEPDDDPVFESVLSNVERTTINTHMLSSTVQALALEGIGRLPARGYSVTLAIIRRFQWRWRARVVGWMGVQETIQYWRAANSRKADSVDTLRALVAACSFKRNAQLRERHNAIRYERNGHVVYRASYSPGLFRFRLVRASRCGYGALACSHVVRDALGAPARDRDGRIIRRSYMNTQLDYDAAARDASVVTAWYLLYAELVQHRYGSGCGVAGFYLPGGHAEGIRQAGYHVAAIDIAADQGDGEKWFNRLVPLLYPSGPTVCVKVQGDARSRAIRLQAVREHSVADSVLFNFDTPLCTPYASMNPISGYNVQAGPAWRSSDAPRVDEQLTEVIGSLHKEWVIQNTPYIVETVMGAKVELPPGVACTVYNAHMFGIRTTDAHRFYTPLTCDLTPDAALVASAKRLATGSCQGMSKRFPASHPDGHPVWGCCVGTDVSMCGNGYSSHNRKEVSRILGIHQEHVSSLKRLHDLLPPAMPKHLVAMLSMYVAQARLHVPPVKFDSVRHDPALGYWVLGIMRLQLRDSAPPVPRIRRCLFVCRPDNMAGTVLIDATVPGLAALPSVRLAATGLLVDGAVHAFNTQYPHANLTPPRLRFVCDLLRCDEPTVVFMVIGLPCNDAHNIPRRDIDLDATVTAPGSEQLVAVDIGAYEAALQSYGTHSIYRAALIYALEAYPEPGFDEARLVRAVRHVHSQPQYSPLCEIDRTDNRFVEALLEGTLRLRPDAKRECDSEQPAERTGTQVAFTHAVEVTPPSGAVVATRGMLPSSPVLNMQPSPAFDSSQFRAHYLSECARLGVKPDLRTQRRSDNAHLPQPITVRCVGAVVRFGNDTTSFAATAWQQLPFMTRSSSPMTHQESPDDVATWNPPSLQQWHSRRHRTLCLHLEEALAPWFLHSTVWDAVCRAVSYAVTATTPHLSSHDFVALNASGQRVSNCTPSRHNDVRIWTVRLGDVLRSCTFINEDYPIFDAETPYTCLGRFHAFSGPVIERMRYVDDPVCPLGCAALSWRAHGDASLAGALPSALSASLSADP